MRDLLYLLWELLLEVKHFVRRCVLLLRYRRCERELRAIQRRRLSDGGHRA